MSAAHTPGPWVECEKPTGALHAVRAPSKYNPLGKVICDVGFGETNEINAANARLIAAAPELLDALEAACSLIIAEVADGAYTEQAKAARAAINKATGRTA